MRKSVTFCTGAWGRPHGLEAHVYRKDPGALFVHWPNEDPVDLYRPDRGPRTPDRNPFEGLESKDYAWDEYYIEMKKRIEDLKPDLIVGCFIDDARIGRLQEVFGDKFPTFVTTYEGAAMEDDRSYGKSTAEDHGLKIGRYLCCTNRDRARQYIEKSSFDGYVLKDNGAGSCVAEIYKSKMEALSAIETRLDRFFPVIVEEFIEGIEIAFSVMVNGRETPVIVVPMVTDFEYTQLATGDIGCETSEMGSHDIAGVCERAMKEIFEPLKPWFKEVKYIGWFDASCIYSPRTNELTVFEFQTRLGSSQFEMAMSMLGSDFRDLALGLINGYTVYPVWAHKHSVAVTVADSYAMIEGRSRGSSVVGPVREMMIGKTVRDYGFASLSRLNTIANNRMEICVRGDRSFLAIGASDRMKYAKRLAYGVMQQCTFPGMFYRTDIGHRWEDEKMRLILGEAGLLPYGWWEE